MSETTQFYSVDALVEATMSEPVKRRYFELCVADEKRKAAEFDRLRARLQEAEWIVGNVYAFPIGSERFLEWMTRRDAWLKGVKSQ